jgi:hypothetical protein
VQDAHNHKLALVMQVIDGELPDKAARSPGAECSRKEQTRENAKGLAIVLDLVDQPRRRRLGSFTGNIKPNLGKIGFCRGASGLTQSDDSQMRADVRVCGHGSNRLCPSSRRGS